MESNPRRWVMKPLSPRLEQQDLYSIHRPTGHRSLDLSWSNNDKTPNYDSILVAATQSTVMFFSQRKERSVDVVMKANQLTVFEETCNSSDNWLPNSPSSSSSSSTGSLCSFYSFVEDPASPEAELNKAWMISPERQAKLATLKKESGFKLQTYSSGRKPKSLFQESNGDSQYKVDINDRAHVVAQPEDKQIRKIIISSQAPKKTKTAFRKQWHALESLDLMNSPKNLMAGFSLYYEPRSPKPGPTTVIFPESIDNEQINFCAAREQFLKLEKARLATLLFSPTSLNIKERVLLASEASKRGERVQQCPPLWKEQLQEDPLKGRKITLYGTELPVNKRVNSFIDYLDSGLDNVSVGQCGGYTSDTSICTIQTESSDSQLANSYMEKPIEKEICIAQERVDSLRQSRGLHHSNRKADMLEIKTKPLLLYSTPLLTTVKTKDKNRVSFLIQREIEQDTKRQDDLLHQSKVSDLYDRETSQERAKPTRVFHLLDNSGIEKQSGIMKEKKTNETKCLVSGERDTNDVQSSCWPHQQTEEKELYINQIKSSPTSVSLWRSKVKKLSNAQLPCFPHLPVFVKPKVLLGGQITIPNEIANDSFQEGKEKALDSNRVFSDKEGFELTSKVESQREVEGFVRREQMLEKVEESSDLYYAFLENNMGQDVDFVSQHMIAKEQPLLSDNLTPSVQQIRKLTGCQFASPITTLKKERKDYVCPAFSSSRPATRLPNSILMAKPWGSPLSPSAVQGTSLMLSNKRSENRSPKGLTGTVLQDFEEKIVQLKPEDNAEFNLLTT